MCNLTIRNVCLLIFRLLYHVSIVRNGSTDSTYSTNEFMDWKIDTNSSIDVGNFSQELWTNTTPAVYHPCRNTTPAEIPPPPQLHVKGGSVKGNFTIVLFAIPYVKNKSDCETDSTFIKNEQLRQHSQVKKFTGYNPEGFQITFANIFTGCYYTVMINERDEKMLVSGVNFYETNYTFIDDTLYKVKDTQIVPKDVLNTKQLKTIIEIRSKHIQVFAWLENNEEDSGRKEVMKNNSNTQKCVIKISSKDGIVTECRNLTHSVLEVRVLPGNNQWRVETTWRNLSHENTVHRLEFEPDYIELDRLWGTNGFMYRRDLWISPGPTSIYYRIRTASDDNEAKLPQDVPLMEIVIGLTSLISMLLITHKVFKFAGIVKRRRQRAKESDDKMKVNVPLYDEKESKDIFAIYKRDGSVTARNKIAELLRCLKENCSEFRVHDLYDEQNSWREIFQLRPTGWVEEVLRKGSKIVWIDTPEFRSRAKDKDMQGDCREDVIPYALTLAKDYNKDPTTQYRRHFVVRIKGFEVQEGEEDPLKVITPHARYYIPDQLHLLCEHLKSSVESSSENTEESEITEE